MNWWIWKEYAGFQVGTLPKTNIAPENGPSQKETMALQPLVSFQEGYSSSKLYNWIFESPLDDPFLIPQPSEFQPTSWISNLAKHILLHGLVGGWTNPSEKYSSNWIISPRFGVNIKNIWNRRSCRSHRVGAVTRRQSIVSLVLWALHGIAKQW